MRNHTTPPPEIRQQVTFIYTHYLTQSSEFYETILGLPLALDQGTCRIYQTCSTGFIGLCENPEVTINPSGVILTLATTEVNAWYETLLQRGVSIEKPPTYNPKYNIEHFFIRDPNGYLIEIQKFLDPAWPQAR